MKSFDQNGIESVVAYDPDLLWFEFGGMAIRNPFVSDCARFDANPLVDYPFTIVEEGGAPAAWGLELPDGGHLLLTHNDCLQPPVAGQFDDAVLMLVSAEGRPVASCVIKDIPFEV